MNKILTPLEALNNIRKLVNDVQYASKIPSIDDELDIIEKALKEKEANEKKLQALEIIKENCFLKEYMGDLCLVSKRYITDKNAIDLLKEIMK